MFVNLIRNKNKNLLKKIYIYIFIVVVWLFLILWFSFSFFNAFLLSLLYQAIFRWPPSFWDFVFFVFKESTLQHLKKNQVQIIVFNKKIVVKMSRISNSKSLPWNLVKFRSKFCLVNVSIILCWIFLVLIVN